MAPYNAALAMLARRDHSQKELEQKLRSKFSISAIELTALLDALRAHDYLNDRRFAQSYTRARMRKGFGPERIKLELREKGVEDEFIAAAISSEELDWSDIAHSVWQKKYRAMPSDFKEKARQSGFLKYRGFNSHHLESLFEEKL